jgi:hypothetical protein
MVGVILLTAQQHLLVSAAAGIAVYALAVAGLALLRSDGPDRRRPVRAFAGLVEPVL